MAKITQLDAIQYEIASSWWASWISNETLRNWAAEYMANKARKKYKRYEYFLRNRNLRDSQAKTPH